MALVTPPQGEDPGVVAAVLLDLADDPSDVRTTMDGPLGLAFVVPDPLAQKWTEIEVKAKNLKLEDEEEDHPAKRGPGRPRKDIAASEGEDK
jgi:hypothetical protein